MNVWSQIETAPESAALFSWKLRFGGAMPQVAAWFLRKGNGRARTVPCPRRCGCIHRVTADGYAVCDCGDCEDILLSPEDAERWEANWSGFCMRLCEAFQLDHRPSVSSIPGVWQLGFYGDHALPILAIVQSDRIAFNAALHRLVLQANPFIALVPTANYIDIESREIVSRTGARLIDLESNVGILDSGRLVARRSTKELFGNSGSSPAAAPRSDVGSARQFSFRQAGSSCDIVFDGSSVFHIRNTDGAKYLDYLLHHPNHAIRAVDLEAKIKLDKANARNENSIQATADTRAKREARKELIELKAELEAAEAALNAAAAKRLKAEIGMVESVAASDAELGGNPGERARNNVRKAIDKVLRKLKKGGPDEQGFGRHIAQFVSLGYEVIYNQADGVKWG